MPNPVIVWRFPSAAPAKRIVAATSAAGRAAGTPDLARFTPIDTATDGAGRVAYEGSAS